MRNTVIHLMPFGFPEEKRVEKLVLTDVVSSVEKTGWLTFTDKIGNTVASFPPGAVRFFVVLEQETMSSCDVVFPALGGFPAQTVPVRKRP